MQNKKRVAILISGRGSNMAALMAAAQAPAYPAEMGVVISNRGGAPGLEHAEAAGIPTIVIDHSAYGADRELFDHAIQAALDRNEIDLVCLAGFMRLLTPGFARQWHGRLLNIHPALLPAFKGLDTHRRALAAGVKIHGATVHFVVAEVDSGPIVAQAAIPVHDDDDVCSLAARVLELEHRIYPMALRLVASGQVRLLGQRCIIGKSGSGQATEPLIVPHVPE
jgi:phosphoribosylglycinamide formyltransferase-1